MEYLSEALEPDNATNVENVLQAALVLTIHPLPYQVWGLQTLLSQDYCIPFSSIRQDRQDCRKLLPPSCYGPGCAHLPQPAVDGITIDRKCDKNMPSSVTRRQQCVPSAQAHEHTRPALRGTTCTRKIRSHPLEPPTQKWTYATPNRTGSLGGSCGDQLKLYVLPHCYLAATESLCQIYWELPGFSGAATGFSHRGDLSTQLP
ncbi:hypothetical protein B0H11DRAFT_2202303 [Mycena galericulata]|nr:hypothetical protein B0H11DRAFT_2202303 [Mycena galericulata]